MVVTIVSLLTLLIILPDTSSRDALDDPDWEQKEESRTHSVKFTEEYTETKEVSLCCCYYTVSNVYSHDTWPKTKRHAYTQLFKLPQNYHGISHNARSRLKESRLWFRRHVIEKLRMQRAYNTLSTVLVALD